MYNVVFEYNANAGAYARVRTFSGWPTKEDFDKAYADWPDEVKDKQMILVEGVTAERATELCGQTPIEAYFAVAIKESTDEEGTIDPFLLNLELAKLLHIS